MRSAIIDIGSNSTKLIIGEDVEQEIKILETLKNVVGIGKSVFLSGHISQEVINELIIILEKYLKIINSYGIEQVKVVATTAVREAQNRDLFLDTIKRRVGVDIDVLEVGDVVYYIDAYLTHKLQKFYPINEKNLLVAELGAGSLDISVMEKGFTIYNAGIPIGTLRLNQFQSRIEGSRKETCLAIEEYVDNEISNLKKSLLEIPIDDVILIDESYSVVLQYIFPLKKNELNFFQFQYRESKQLMSRLTERNISDLSLKFNIPPDITDTIENYAIILNKLFQMTSKRSLYVLVASLSEALLAHQVFNLEIAKKYNKEKQLISVAKFLGRRFGSDPKHIKQVTFLSDELFKLFKDLLGLNEGDALYLTLAAYLHSVGLFLTNRGYHKHSEYIISSLSLFRLTAEEIRCIACIARYHRKAPPLRTHFVYGRLSSRDQLLVQKLSSLLRMASALEASHKQKVKKLEVAQVRSGELNLVVSTPENMALEKVTFDESKQLFEQVSGVKIKLKIQQGSVKDAP